MSNVTVITNNVPRDVLWGLELSEKERAEFDYLNPDELDYATFFRYKGEVYDLGEFMRIDEPVSSIFKGWDGYSSDSFFSGVLVRYVDDGQIVVGRYYS